jgi:hypothetical protein
MLEIFSFDFVIFQLNRLFKKEFTNSSTQKQFCHIINITVNAMPWLFGKVKNL